MSSSSAPIEIGHRKKTIQQTYGDKVVGRVRELFGVDSVEYGLAISGSPKLVPLLEQHIRTFSPDAVLQVADERGEHREGIVNAAQRMIDVRDVKNDAYTERSLANLPSWFE